MRSTPKRIVVFIFLLNFASSTVWAQAPSEGSPTELKELNEPVADEEPTFQYRTRSYRLQLLVGDLLSYPLMAIGSSAAGSLNVRDEEIFIVGALPLGPLAVHLWNKNYSSAAISFGMRLGAGIVAVNASNSCVSADSEGPDFSCTFAGVGEFIALYSIALAVDYLILANKEERVPTKEWAWVPTIEVKDSSAVLGLAGRF